MRGKEKRNALSDEVNGGGEADRHTSERDMRKRSSRSNQRRHSPSSSLDKSDKDLEEGNEPQTLEAAREKLYKKKEKEDILEKRGRGSSKDGTNQIKVGRVGDTEADDEWKEDSSFWEEPAIPQEHTSETPCDHEKITAGSSNVKEIEEMQKTQELAEIDEAVEKPEKKGVSDPGIGTVSPQGELKKSLSGETIEDSVDSNTAKSSEMSETKTEKNSGWAEVQVGKCPENLDTKLGTDDAEAVTGIEENISKQRLGETECEKGSESNKAISEVDNDKEPVDEEGIKKMHPRKLKIIRGHGQDQEPPKRRLFRKGREKNEKQKDEVTTDKEKQEDEMEGESSAVVVGETEERTEATSRQSGKKLGETEQSYEESRTTERRKLSEERGTDNRSDKSKSRSRSPRRSYSHSLSSSRSGNRSRSPSQKSSRSGSDSSRRSHDRSQPRHSSKSSSSSRSGDSDGGSKRHRKGDKEKGEKSSRRRKQRSPRTSPGASKKKSQKKSSAESEDEKHHSFASVKEKKSRRTSKEEERVACDSLFIRETKKLRRNSAVEAEKATSLQLSVREKRRPKKDSASDDEKSVSPTHASGRESHKHRLVQASESEDENSYSPRHSPRKEKKRTKTDSASRSDCEKSSYSLRSSSRDRKKLKRKSSTKSEYEKKVSPSYTSHSEKREQRSDCASKFDKKSTSPVRTSSKERKKHRRDSARPDEYDSPGREEKRKRKHRVEQEQKENSAPGIRKGSHETESNQLPVRKRKWGSKSVALKRAVSISTASLKGLIPDVKPVSLTEVKLEEGDDSPRPRRPSRQAEMRPVASNELEDEEKAFSSGKIQRKISVLSNDGPTLQAPSPARNKPSNVLFITNLVRPFTINQLRELLARTGTVVERGFWIDKIKSKCYVMYKTEEQAIETRHALHGVKWPVSNPKNLVVDFATLDDLEYHKAITDTEPYPRKTKPLVLEPRERERETRKERRRSAYEENWKEDHKVSPPVREWDRDKVRDVSPVEYESRWSREKEREREDRDRERDKKSRKEKRRSRSGSPGTSQNRKSKKKEEEAPAKLLDDLFRKTKTTPCIYWLPLTTEQILQKEELRRQRMLERDRRLAEMQKAQKEKDQKSEDRDRKYGSSARRKCSSSTSPRRHI